MFKVINTEGQEPRIWGPPPASWGRSRLWAGGWISRTAQARVSTTAWRPFPLQPRGIQTANGAPGSACRLALGLSIGSEESRVRSLCPGERGPLLWGTAGQAPGLLTHRRVLREAEQGHVSVGAARPVVEEVGGEVGLS